MRQRKLQIFLSSTYEDLIEQRLAAMEAILKAGHIPAAMEQFSPGDETAWDRIKTWIDGSDAFILILGGRYGSVEPTSGKSYIQLEYEYALEKKKPFFALVIEDAHHEKRTKRRGFEVDERAHRDKYDQFKRIVTQRLCAFWGDLKDIQLAILQKLPEWAQRPDLAGWVRAEELPCAEATNEMARLSQENRELRSKLTAQAESFEGLTFEEFAKLLREIPLGVCDPEHSVKAFENSDEGIKQGVIEAREAANVGQFFDCLQEGFWKKHVYFSESGAYPEAIQVLLLHDLIEVKSGDKEGYYGQHILLTKLTNKGRRFRNRMLMAGDREERRRQLWSLEQSAPASGSTGASA